MPSATDPALWNLSQHPLCKEKASEINSNTAVHLAKFGGCLITVPEPQIFLQCTL